VSETDSKNSENSSDRSVIVEKLDEVAVVWIARPDYRNAVDRTTAQELLHSFEALDKDESVLAMVLAGKGGTFCSGADLRAVAEGRGNVVTVDGPGPMGPTRLRTLKPVLAAIEGYAVAGGLELALWCDIRVAARDSVLGVFNRRWGVPLVDGGTVRLPRLIGLGRALDLILTGRPVGAEEAHRIGLVEYLTEPGQAVSTAVDLAHRIAGFPQESLRRDRLSTYEQAGLGIDEALRNEARHGLEALRTGEAIKGAMAFVKGAGRHGTFEDFGSAPSDA
jgi:enoyl-CoA hydratase